jgi:hypothetical protein
LAEEFGAGHIFNTEDTEFTESTERKWLGTTRIARMSTKRIHDISVGSAILRLYSTVYDEGGVMDL